MRFTPSPYSQTESQRFDPMTTRGMVTSPHYLATQSGVDILRKGGTALDAVEQLGKRPRHQRGLLRLAHLGRRHHLHRAGDLRGAADRLDARTKLSCTGHNSPFHFHFHDC